MALAPDFCPGGEIGVNIATDDNFDRARGTICCFVFKKNKQQLYLLTCGHVLNPPGKQRAAKLVFDSQGNTVATISDDDLLFDMRVLEGMDAGLAKMSKAKEMKRANFCVAGTSLPFAQSMNMYRVPGQNWDVMVRGARTALYLADPQPKPGKMNDAGYSGRFKITPTKSLIKNDFAWIEGDSGAPVFNNAGVLLAMVTTGSSQGGVGAFSIGFVFSEFQKKGVDLELATWSNRSQWLPPDKPQSTLPNWTESTLQKQWSENPLAH